MFCTIFGVIISVITLIFVMIREKKNIESQKIQKLIDKLELLFYKRAFSSFQQDLSGLNRFCIIVFRASFILLLIICMLNIKIDFIITILALALGIVIILGQVVDFAQTPKKYILNIIGWGSFIILSPLILYFFEYIGLQESMALPTNPLSNNKEFIFLMKLLGNDITKMSELGIALNLSLIFAIVIPILLIFMLTGMLTLAFILRLCSWSSIKGAYLFISKPVLIYICILILSCLIEAIR